MKKHVKLANMQIIEKQSLQYIDHKRFFVLFVGIEVKNSTPLVIMYFIFVLNSTAMKFILLIDVKLPISKH